MSSCARHLAHVLGFVRKLYLYVYNGTFERKTDHRAFAGVESPVFAPNRFMLTLLLLEKEGAQIVLINPCGFPG